MGLDLTNEGERAVTAANDDQGGFVHLAQAFGNHRGTLCLHRHGITPAEARSFADQLRAAANAAEQMAPLECDEDGKPRLPQQAVPVG